MKRCFRPWACCVALWAGTWLISPANASTVYDLSTDFDKVHNPSGVWSFGWKTTLGGSFKLSDVARQDPLGVVPIDTWSHGSGTSEVQHNGTTNTGTSSSGGS